MTLESRLSALITAIGADIKALQAASGGGVPFYTKPRKTIEVFDEYLGNLGNSLVSISGTGATAGVVTTTPSGSDAYGVVQLYTGTDSLGRACLRSNLSQMLPGKGKMYYATRIYVSETSDASNRYNIRAGLGDNDSAEHTYGVYFEFDTTVTTQWRCVTSVNGTRTKVNSGVDCSINATYVLGIEINAAGTEAKFYINDTLVATITTNIPGAYAWEICGYGVWLVKTAGTQGRFIQVDYQGIRIERTLNR